MIDTERAPDLLASAHPVLRTVGIPEAPYPGVLRRVGPERTMLFVDAGDFGGTPSWSCDPHGHVLAPHDVARRVDGHDVVLAHCVERLADVVARRAREGALAPGEIVTIAVSLRRGLAELLATGADPEARWWLTEDGRPVIACAESGECATAATAGLVAALRAGADDALDAALRSLADAAVHPRALARDADLIEGALFAAATPVAVGRQARTSSLASLRPSPVERPSPPPSRWDALLRDHLDGEIADLTAAAVRSVGRRFGRGRRRDDGRVERRTGGGAEDGRPERGAGERMRRARPLLLAAGLAGVVVAVGLLWPSSDAPPTARVAPASTAAEALDAVPTTPGGGVIPPPLEGDGRTTAPPQPVETSSQDPVVIAGALLAAADACGGDGTCLSALVEESSGPTGERVAALASTPTATPELVDSFGGAAVVRVAHDGTSSLVVIVENPTGWVVRDVYDVADPL